MSHAPKHAGLPPGPRNSPLASLVAAVVAVAGLAVLASRPDRIAFDVHTVLEPSDYACAVDALGVSEYDVACGDAHRVLLGRLLQGEVKYAWQENFFDRAITPYPDAALDVDGDGAEELCLSVSDSSCAHAFALDADGRVVARVDSVSAQWERRGVRWDGRQVIVAALVHEGRRKLVCMMHTGFARVPRGIGLYDAETGARDWYYDMGTFPNLVTTGDVDADGAPEIVVSTSSPDNGASRNGTDDGHAYVVALGLDGRRHWQVEMGGRFGQAYARVLPAADAGHPRVVATFASFRALGPEPGRLALIDGASGRVLERGEFPGGLRMPRVVGGRVAFVVGSTDGTLRAFGYDLRVLHARSFPGPVEAWGSADVDQDGEPEIVASVPGAVLLLDRALRPRGRLAVRLTPQTAPGVEVGRAGVGHVRLAIEDGRALLADIRSERALADPAALGVVAGLALLGGVSVPTVRRLRRSRRKPSGAAAREFLLDYHQIRHETFEHERPFARLRLYAQAEAAGHPLPERALENACEEFLRIGLPTMRRFADRAAALQVDRMRVRSIRRGAHTVADALRAVRAGRGDERVVHLRRALEAIDALAQQAYDAYWEVIQRAPCRPAQVAAEAMLGKRDALERGRIISRFEADPVSREPVLFDRDELRALVGELVENAARSLAGAPEAVITVRALGHPTDPRRVVVTVQDSGPALSPAQREGLFSPGASSRPGGGFGLHHARETAHRWLAELTVEDPPEGSGVELRLLLRACRIADGDPAPERREDGP